MSEHTPGPWKFLRDESGSGDRVFGFDVSAANGASIAYYDADYRPETEANARLIAAAPELLEALRWFVDDERFQVAVGGNPIVVERMIADAQAIYLKAKGEAR